MKIRFQVGCVCIGVFLASAARAQLLTPPQYQIENTEVVAIHSRILKREYDLYVKLPKSYAQQPLRRYPVVFLNDARYSFPLVSSLTRQLINAGRIEDLVIVGISYSKGDDGDLSRTRDYTPTRSANESNGHSLAAKQASGQAPAYLQFLTDEVFPFVAKRYRLDMSRKTYAGHSFGGLFGAYVVATAPSTFENYLLSDPSLWYDQEVIFSITKQPTTRMQSLGNVLIVSANPNDGRPNHSLKMIENARRFAGVLTQRFESSNVEQRTFEGEIHQTIFPIAMSRGLLRFYGR